MKMTTTPNNMNPQRLFIGATKTSTDLILTKNVSETNTLNEVGITDDDIYHIMGMNGIGSWKFDMHSQQISLCPRASRFLSLNSGPQVRLYAVLRRLVELNALKLLSVLKYSCQSYQPIEEILKIENGGEQWIKISGEVLRTKSGTLKMLGLITNVTALKAEEQRQKDLMAFLTHELRTPLSTMKLYIRHAYKMANLQESQILTDSLIKADHQTLKMAAMIDDFLTLAHLEATRILLNISSFDLTQLVEELTENMAFMHPNRVFKIKLSKPIMIEADREKLGRVIANYISNAVKYSPEDCPIRVDCRKSGEKVNFRVIDEGTGLSPADQKQLFKRFARVGHQKMIATKGFGLGLFLSREIIEAHKGKVWVKSKLGNGSVFGFTLVKYKG